jgi:hypothetical protein
MLSVQSGREVAEVSRRAAEVVVQRLARDGLLATLAKAIHVLGPKRILADGPAALRLIREVGIPVDLLASFAMDGTGSTNASITVVQHIARKLAEDSTVEAVGHELARIPFRFVPANERFKVADESGASTLGLLRMQAALDLQAPR